ncbi:unnamed protein product [Hermetia illucens]|uniref:Uncharacterized protein n=1 Tax=Hermetia illucens TaxID=343691 RepID=A0A7R8UTI0_HERIL|nr:unnamed protein product [Hermetia illucens]
MLTILPNSGVNYRLFIDGDAGISGYSQVPRFRFPLLPSAPSEQHPPPASNPRPISTHSPTLSSSPHPSRTAPSAVSLFQPVTEQVKSVTKSSNRNLEFALATFPIFSPILWESIAVKFAKEKRRVLFPVEIRSHFATWSVSGSRHRKVSENFREFFLTRSCVCVRAFCSRKTLSGVSLVVAKFAFLQQLQ